MKSVAAYVLVRVNIGTVEEVLHDLMNLKGITKVHAVTGIYDIIVEFSGIKIIEALSTIIREVQKIPDIKHTETLIASDL